MRRPFMTSPTQLASLEGQQYLVLRPTRAVSDVYRAEQRSALGRMDAPHPHTEHVTLRAFHEPERREELLSLIREWAVAQRPIEVVAEAVDVFPTPWQIVILRLTRTSSLVSAYANLSTALEATDFLRLDERSTAEWTFHLSVIYAKTLSTAAWTELSHKSRRSLSKRPAETISEAEFVWYENGIEHSEVIPFGLRSFR
ncbi:2'-5' RNA ligase family protein [Microbacterium sp. Leaf320]|uniref:2'-5' RNA ligase family protein n=1 Tax=Microbacterium sp. Leaf320 TaxID=1736334 RepID=UPI001F2E7A3B|nr:2'-5' RNA ligase family protein [Microbacterium sp. Leaf320]